MYYPPAQVAGLTTLPPQNKQSLQLGRRWPKGTGTQVFAPVAVQDFRP